VKAIRVIRLGARASVRVGTRCGPDTRTEREAANGGTAGMWVPSFFMLSANDITEWLKAHSTRNGHVQLARNRNLRSVRVIRCELEV
jgi:hypothetical protein